MLGRLLVARTSVIVELLTAAKKKMKCFDRYPLSVMYCLCLAKN